MLRVQCAQAQPRPRLGRSGAWYQRVLNVVLMQLLSALAQFLVASQMLSLLNRAVAAAERRCRPSLPVPAATKCRQACSTAKPDAVLIWCYSRAWSGRGARGELAEGSCARHRLPCNNKRARREARVAAPAAHERLQTCATNPRTRLGLDFKAVTANMPNRRQLTPADASELQSSGADGRPLCGEHPLRRPPAAASAAQGPANRPAAAQEELETAQRRLHPCELVDPHLEL